MQFTRLFTIVRKWHHVRKRTRNEGKDLLAVHREETFGVNIVTIEWGAWQFYSVYTVASMISDFQMQGQGVHY